MYIPMYFWRMVVIVLQYDVLVIDTVVMNFDEEMSQLKADENHHHPSRDGFQKTMRKT